ncbi:MAG TPA: site-2 protease family protein [Gemmatimonadaceae bacterium]|nr:site-2 protease family protein [Gemmatimonadaceae bacterium]
MQQIGTFLLMAPMLLFSMVAHEYAHGYAALRQGDPTAYELGRLTWNPVRHIDPFMTVILPLILFFTHMPILGGAKPVPVNPRNYRRYKRGDIIVSLAGVATNLAIAVLCVPLIILAGLVGRVLPAAVPSLALLQAMLHFGVVFNLILVTFNLIPIPPLDGSHVIKHLLPPAWSLRYQQVGRFGIILLLLLLFYTPVSWWIWPVNAGAQLLLAPAAAFHLPTTLAL